MVQQSNCFIVVERGVGMQNMMQERALAGVRASCARSSNMGGGQMVTRRLHPDARRSCSPRTTPAASAARSAGCSATQGRPRSARSPAASSSRKRRPACWSPTRAAACRSRRPRAAPRRPTCAWAARCSAAASAAAAGGYGNTNEGKIIAAAFMDNYNNVVRSVRSDPSLQRNVGTLQAGSRGRRHHQGRARVFNEGDVHRAEDRERAPARRSQPTPPRCSPRSAAAKSSSSSAKRRTAT